MFGRHQTLPEYPTVQRTKTAPFPDLHTRTPVRDDNRPLYETFPTLSMVNGWLANRDGEFLLLASRSPPRAPTLHAVNLNVGPVRSGVQAHRGSTTTNVKGNHGQPNTPGVLSALLTVASRRSMSGRGGGFSCQCVFVISLLSLDVHHGHVERMCVCSVSSSSSN